jgi:hypothetical protein
VIFVLSLTQNSTSGKDYKILLGENGRDFVEELAYNSKPGI